MPTMSFIKIFGPPVLKARAEVVESRKHGYTSIPDFVKDAVRRYLRELGYLL